MRGSGDASPHVAAAWIDEDSWRDGVRAGLAALLLFLDAGQSLMADGVLATVSGVIHAHLVTAEPAREREPLIALLGPLVGIVLGPYFDSSAVAGEIQKAARLSREIQDDHAALFSQTVPMRVGDVPAVELDGVEIPALLSDVRAERARSSVLYLAAHPGSSNRQIGAGVGVAHEGQISKLLRRLEACGVGVRHSHGPGRPNAWRLTAYGEEVAAHFGFREDDLRAVAPAH